MNRAYQIRRQTRRMRRYGIQPMIVMNSEDGLPDLVAVVLARWAWRYRSELAPAALAVTALLTSWALHETHPRIWPAIAAGTGITATVLYLSGRRLGLQTSAERIYAATATAITGGWLAAATAVSPWRPPLPLVLATAALVLAVPWWAHRRRRAKVRVERTLAAWPDIARATGLPGSHVQSAVVDLWGWRARFALARGQTINDVISKIPAIESGLGTFRGAVRVSPTPDDLANRFELRVLNADPHADAITWPGPSVISIAEPIDLGPFEDATPAKVLFLRRHGLFGGVSGSGKSGGLNVLLGNLSACTDVVIWAIDLKRGVELGPWAPCIARLATTPAEASALLADAVAVLEARADHLASKGRRVWEPTEHMPALVIIVDEYAELAETAPEATADADSIARRGRAVAVTLIAATQRPTQRAMGQGALRSQMDIRMCFRVRERRDVDLILGQGMLTAGWRADQLNAPGKFLISSPEHDNPRRARGYLMTDQDVAETANWHAALRPPLDDISQQAIVIRANRQPTADDEPETGREPSNSDDTPEVMFWAALAQAPAKGASIADLINAAGMSRRWVYYRLRSLADAGRVTQTETGNWRRTDCDSHPQ